MATLEEEKRTWLLLAAELESARESDLKRAVELVTVLSGERIQASRVAGNASLLRHVCQVLELGLAAGELCLEEVPQNAELDDRIEYVLPAPPKPTAPRPRGKPPAVPAPMTWFEVEVVDELGESVNDLELVFNIAGADQPANTNGGGRARVDLPSTASSASVKFAASAAVRLRLYERWQQCRGAPWQDPAPVDAVVQVRARAPILAVAVEAKKLRKIVLQPRVVLARLAGVWFDTSKCFLLPTARTTLPLLQGIYDKNPDTHLLVVGHTDRAGEPSYNDPLSVERARSILAYLENDVEAWYAWYGTDKPYEKRWGSTEDQLMIMALGCPDGVDPVSWFQSQHAAEGLEVDGIAGKDTRHELIAAYMDLDRTTLPPSITAEVHGCGENHPLIPTADGEREQVNRRVELFFFDGPVLPPPPGLNSSASSLAYPEWVLRAKETYEFDPDGLRVIDVRLHDADKVPLSSVPYRVSSDGTVLEEGIAGDGWVHLRLPGGSTNMVDCEWGTPTATGSFPFHRAIRIDHDAGTERDQASARLHNLGYAVTSAADYEPAVRAFQDEYQIPEAGLVGDGLPPLTKSKLWLIYETDCDASCEPPPSGATP